MQAQTVVLGVAPDRLGGQGPGVEDQAVLGDRHYADFPHRSKHIACLAAPVAGEVEVARSPVGCAAPKCEEHGPFEDIAVAVRGFAKATQEALRGVALKQELEVLPGFPAAVE